MSNLWTPTRWNKRYRSALVAAVVFTVICLYMLAVSKSRHFQANRITVSEQACSSQVTENKDLLPYAACHLMKQTWDPTAFVYGFGAQNVHYPASEDQEQQTVMRVEYPKNSINPLSGRVGGVGWYTHDSTPRQEIYFQYSVQFQQDFKFQKGGKLPGVYGGRVECSGGNAALDCFSLRLMWRKNGNGEAYLYVPKNEQDPSISTIPPFTEINPTYGISAGRGAFKFTAGQWDTVGMYVKLNDIGKANGIFKVWHNNKLAIEFDKVVWRTMDISIDGIQFETFFGGSKPGFEAPEQSYTYFSNVFYASQPPSSLP